MTRLRYREINGLLTLYKPLVAKDDLVIVSIDKKRLEAIILSVNTHIPKAGVTANNLVNLKKKVKKEFLKLGVVFQAEVRPGRNI